MRRAVCAAGAAVLVGGPTVLAFFSGGYFEVPRLVAAIVACALVALVALACPVPLPRSATARVALAALALLCVWTGLSIAWAPLAGSALADAQRLLLYLAAFTAALALLRDAGAARALEPALAAGAVVVVVYGLSERLLPGLVQLDRSVSAGARLEQPLTYWNAMGLVAALGLLLCMRLAADGRRRDGLRIAAAAAGAPLGLGVYLTFSRGALVTVGAGVVVLLALAPDLRAQARAGAVVLAGAALPSLASAALPATRALDGSGRGAQGAVLLAVVVLAAAAAGAAIWRLGPPSTRVRVLRVRAARATVTGVLATFVVGVLGAAALERSPDAPTPFGATAARFTSAETTRYDYWEVALGAFADDPLRGSGSGSFGVEWLRERERPLPATDAHSLYVETAAELGLLGLALLGAFLAAVGLALGHLHARDAAAAAGPGSVLVAWAIHAGLDWDWELPAVSLTALLFAAAVLAWREELVGAPTTRPVEA